VVFDVASPAFRLKSQGGGEEQGWAERRLIRELKPIAGGRLTNTEVGLGRNNLRVWRVFVRGPDNTPFRDRCWSVYVEFPEQYPMAPPEMRFVSGYHELPNLHVTIPSRQLLVTARLINTTTRDNSLIVSNVLEQSHLEHALGLVERQTLRISHSCSTKLSLFSFLNITA
jgi:hypothetical protein